MSEMVERVARALADKRYMSCGGSAAQTLVPGKQNWIFCVDDARVAIEAMREPTEAMVDAALDHLDWGPPGYDEAPGGPATPDTVWETMIDAALK